MNLKFFFFKGKSLFIKYFSPSLPPSLALSLSLSLSDHDSQDDAGRSHGDRRCCVYVPLLDRRGQRKAGVLEGGGRGCVGVCGGGESL